jgi:hypothetical protein
VSELDALRHARSRGEILHLLKNEHPNPIDFQLLRRSLANLALPLLEKDLNSYLVYLEKDGYIELRRGHDNNILCATIANKGLNLIDKWIVDPAVDVG